MWIDKINEQGQTLLEMIVVITVGIIIVGALTFATIGSLRNANFAKNQVQATKLSQEALENVRSIRDRNLPNSVIYETASGPTSTFADLFNESCSPNGCYFTLNSDGTVLTGGTEASYEQIEGVFNRQIVLKDGRDKNLEKEVTSIVEWVDSRGEKHVSRISTILRNQNADF